MGKWQNNVQNLYVNIEKKFLMPPVFAPFWGDIAHFAQFGGILAHFVIHNGQKNGGISHLCAHQNDSFTSFISIIIFKLIIA